MEKKKHVSQSSSSSDESSSNEEEGTQQGFVRSDRKTEKIEDKKAAEEEEDEDEEEEDGDDDDDDGDVDGTQRGVARDNTAKASSSETTQATNSTSETSSASGGKPEKPSHQFVVLPRKAENTNGHGKKAPTSEKPSKVRPAPESSPKKSKDKSSKRDRDAEPQEKGSSKKLKKESSDKPSKTEKVSKEKNIPSHTSEKKKSAHEAALSENLKNAPPQQNSSKHPDNASAKKAAEKSRNDRKATKDSESEPLKGSVSPSKPKLFTPKDELVLTKEILRDIKQGVEIPVKRVDGYWSKLVDRVKGRMEGTWSKEQLCDKVKRMKVRYTNMAEKFKESTQRKFRNSTDKELFGLWDQIWGSDDAMNEDHEREISELKDKQPKPLVAASPVKRGKASRNKVVAPIQDTKMVHEESEGPKSKHTEKQSSDDDDDSESEESDGEGDSHKKGLPVTLMEVDLKDAHADCALLPKGNAVKGHENNSQSLSFSDAQKLLQEEIRTTLSELQESSKETLKEWQSKALVVVENAVKATADQSRLMNRIGVAGFDGMFTPFRGLDLMDSQRAEGDQALEQQWHELELKELDLYCQRLELMQRECQLKQDRLKSQLHRNK